MVAAHIIKGHIQHRLDIPQVIGRQVTAADNHIHPAEAVHHSRAVDKACYNVTNRQDFHRLRRLLPLHGLLYG